MSEKKLETAPAPEAGVLLSEIRGSEASETGNERPQPWPSYIEKVDLEEAKNRLKPLSRLFEGYELQWGEDGQPGMIELGYQYNRQTKEYDPLGDRKRVAVVVPESLRERIEEKDVQQAVLEYAFERRKALANRGGLKIYFDRIKEDGQPTGEYRPKWDWNLKGKKEKKAPPKTSTIDESAEAEWTASPREQADPERIPPNILEMVKAQENIIMEKEADGVRLSKEEKQEIRDVYRRNRLYQNWVGRAAQLKRESIIAKELEIFDVDGIGPSERYRPEPPAVSPSARAESRSLSNAARIAVQAKKAAIGSGQLPVKGAAAPESEPVDSLEPKVADQTEAVPEAPAELEEGIEVASRVYVVDGPYASSEGKVRSINRKKGIITVEIEMFDRMLPINLSFAEVSTEANKKPAEPESGSEEIPAETPPVQAEPPKEAPLVVEQVPQGADSEGRPESAPVLSLEKIKADAAPIMVDLLSHVRNIFPDDKKQQAKFLIMMAAVKLKENHMKDGVLSAADPDALNYPPEVLRDVAAVVMASAENEPPSMIAKAEDDEPADVPEEPGSDNSEKPTSVGEAMEEKLVQPEPKPPTLEEAMEESMANRLELPLSPEKIAESLERQMVEVVRQVTEGSGFNVDADKQAILGRALARSFGPDRPASPIAKVDRQQSKLIVEDRESLQQAIYFYLRKFSS